MANHFQERILRPAAGLETLRMTFGLKNDMKKREQQFAKIDEYLQRFRKTPSDKLATRYNNGYPMIKEASIALHQVLEERGEIGLLNGEQEKK